MKKIKVRVAIAQINPTVGDLEGNSQKIIEYVKQAEKSGADIVCFPELALTGYPPEDLLLKPKFIQDNLKKIKELVSSVGNIIAVVGFVDEKKGNIFNSAAVIYQRKITGTYNKTLLPNYGVFDEKRYFAAGENVKVFQFGELAFGVNICEDIWHEGPVEKQVLSGARLVLNINASPYHMGKIKERQEVVQ
ncbi:MAG: nitrilase-related carbon-nitrogen hydrolase, partial [Candidatus Omnitrophota bacterium]